MICFSSLILVVKGNLRRQRDANYGFTSKENV